MITSFDGMTQDPPKKVRTPMVSIAYGRMQPHLYRMIKDYNKLSRMREPAVFTDSYVSINDKKDFSDTLKYNKNEDEIYIIESMAHDGSFFVSIWSNCDNIWMEHLSPITHRSKREDKLFYDLLHAWDKQRFKERYSSTSPQVRDGSDCIITKIIIEDNYIVYMDTLNTKNLK